MSVQNCRVVIDRGPGNVQHFDGMVVGETTSHFLVRHWSNPEKVAGEEWFPKSCPPHVHVTLFPKTP